MDWTYNRKISQYRSSDNRYIVTAVAGWWIADYWDDEGEPEFLGRYATVEKAQHRCEDHAR